MNQNPFTEHTNQNPGRVFVMHLLMEHPVPMPAKKYMTEVMQKHIPSAECFSCTKTAASFAATAYRPKEKDSVPPALMITACEPVKDWKPDDVALTQMWDCPEAEAILQKCSYHVIAADMLADKMQASDRAEMDMDFLEAVVEMFPSCKAVYFENSGKMFARESVLSCPVPREERFLFYAVNVRYFKMKEDVLVDTLGMKTLSLPDVQYFFHGLETEAMVNHAYAVLSYLLASGGDVKDGDTFDGIQDGDLSEDVQWKCWYDDAHMAPLRAVVDIHTGENASLWTGTDTYDGQAEMPS